MGTSVPNSDVSIFKSFGGTAVELRVEKSLESGEKPIFKRSSTSVRSSISSTELKFGYDGKTSEK